MSKELKEVRESDGRARVKLLPGVCQVVEKQQLYNEKKEVEMISDNK